MTWTILTLNIYTSMFTFQGSYPTSSCCEDAMFDGSYSHPAHVVSCVYISKRTIQDWQQPEVAIKE